MSYKALATDYDGTIATEGKVKQTTITALKRWQETGRKLIMVTGRRLEPLYTIFPEARGFDCIVAENGALLSFPTTGETTLLGEPVPKSLIETLQKRKVEPLAVGQGIVSTRIGHDTTATEVIEELDLSWQISYNKGAVMLLPEGVDKYCGLSKSLEQMNLSAEEVVGVGDGENDLPLLNLCGLAVSVNNALPVLKKESDWVTRYDSGDGVVELIDLSASIMHEIKNIL
ncbi:MAG: HAD family hydrolase [Xenococcaceae cyanobacterium MO_207.B15]|nr:HAD family hydrolase [Xenococcaceae cyanobacterium MO_207.B15]